MASPAGRPWRSIDPDSVSDLEPVAPQFDPEVDVNWRSSFSDDLDFHSDHALSLSGTRLWGSLSPDQHRALARSEAAELLGLAIVGKAFVSHLLLRTAQEEDQESARLRRTLAELGDNGRHIVMLARALESFAAPEPVLLPPWFRRTLPFAQLIPPGPMTWASILMVNELLIGMQAELMEDERVQPAMRMVSQVHVVDQARHVTHARHELLRTVRGIGPLERVVTQSVLAAGAVAFRYLRIRPRAYGAAGINPLLAWLVAGGNPVYDATLARYAERLVATFQEAGLIEGPLLKAAWRHAGILKGAA